MPNEPKKNLNKKDWAVLGGALGALVLFAFVPMGWLIVLIVGGIAGAFFGVKSSRK